MHACAIRGNTIRFFFIFLALLNISPQIITSEKFQHPNFVTKRSSVFSVSVKVKFFTVAFFGVRPTLLITLGAHFCHSISSHHHIRPAITFHHILNIGQIYIQNSIINFFLLLDIAFCSHSYILKDYDRPTNR